MEKKYVLILLPRCNSFQGFLSFLNTLQDSHWFPEEAQRSSTFKNNVHAFRFSL